MLNDVFAIGYLKGLKKLGLHLPQSPRLFKTMPPASNLGTTKSAIKAIQPPRTSVRGRENTVGSLKPTMGPTSIK